MSFERPLRGSCACHRNQYFIRAPQDADEIAQVLFGTDSFHRASLATPLSAHIRIPLTWYHSATYALYPDETAAQIRRVYENPLEGHSRRQFCGFCGTPLTYWSEEPRAEADYIQVTMGSLCREDLGDLEDLGLIPASPSALQPVTTATTITTGGRETTSIPWFDSIVEGSSLGGRLRTTKGTRRSGDGTTRIEFEIIEYNEGGGGGGGGGGEAEDSSTPSAAGNGKRKLGDRDD
ncbi:hypothetical protein M406DRAFT_233428, partial [Cryphonectria parasitica EP155]